MIIIWGLFLYLIPNRNYPWPSLPAEAISFFIFSTIFIINKKIKINNLSIAISVFSTYPIIQYIFGQIIFIDDAIIGFIYINLLAISIQIGYSEKYNKANQNILEFTIVISSIIAAGISTSQWVLGYSTLTLINTPTGERFSANIGQANHLSTLLMIAYAIIYSWKIKKTISTTTFLISSFFLLLSIYQTGSRTFIAQIFAIAIYLLLKNKKTISFQYLLQTTSIYLIAALSSNALIETLGALDIEKTNFMRTDSSHRISIYINSIISIKERLFFGYGFNQVNYAFMENVKLIKKTGLILSSTHNIALDLLIFFGLIPVLLAIYIYIKKLKRHVQFEQNFTPKVLIPIIIGTHSLFEHPHFYSYFITIFGYFLGLNVQKININKQYSIISASIIKSSILSSMFLFYFFLSLNIDFLNLNNKEYTAISHVFLEGNSKKIYCEAFRECPNDGEKTLEIIRRYGTKQLMEKALLTPLPPEQLEEINFLLKNTY